MATNELLPGEPMATNKEQTPKRAGVWENLGRSLVDVERRARWRVALAAGISPGPGRRFPLVRLSLAVFALAAGLALLLVLQLWRPFHLPAPLASPEATALLAVLVAACSARACQEARHSVVFHRRFLRPGLERLLDLEGERLYRGEKLFRGHHTVIMKVDIVGFTRDTFPMPYGMRRLFLDLWFTLIDQVVADRVFFDKSLGDGSFYCFDAEAPEGGCHAALRAALAIRDRQVGLFDTTFRRLLQEKLRASEELREHAERFLAGYQLTAGRSFWKRCTHTRIALVSGYVDEGLWGLSSHSHYDVQGKLPILASRIEQTAGTDEVVFDEAFLAALEDERPGRLDRSGLRVFTAVLRGIGERTLLAVPPGVDPFRHPDEDDLPLV